MAKKKTVGSEILKTLEDSRIDSSLIIDQGCFDLPTEKDFYSDSVPINFLKNIDKAMNNKNNACDVLFYKEDPYSTELGYHKEGNVFVIGFNDLKSAICENGVADADTVYFNYNSINDGNDSSGMGFDIEGKHYTSFKNYAGINMDAENLKKGKLGIRFVGINSPEIPHYINAESKEKYENSRNYKTKTIKFSSTKNSSSIVYDKTVEHKDTDEIFLVKAIDGIDNKWHELRQVDGKNKIVFIDESDGANTIKTKQALQAKKTVEDILSSAEDIRVVIDAKVINRSSKSAGYNFEYLADTWGLIKSLFDFDSKPPALSGWNAPGQEYNKRFLGCIYIKKTIPTEDGSMQSVWINLSKYLLSLYDTIEANPNYWNDPLTGSTNNFAADAFKLWTYGGYKNRKIIDAIDSISAKDLDDRNKIQQEITGLNLEELKDFTVMIGDCLLLVPPTSIRVVTQSSSTRIPLLRSRGAMTKGGQRSERKIELTLYFNEDGINGIPYNTKLPNGESITYYMNGLRALISQFKFTPFLPIENDYINKVLNVEAVSLINMQISTMPNYPKCLAVTLQLEEFNYRIYMPEIPIPNIDSEKLNKNLFASTINFEVLRWYYQRPILKGEDIKLYPFDSIEYTNATFGSRTVLQPMNFTTSNLDFYLIDKEFLDKQLQLKLNSINAPLKGVNTLSDSQRKIMPKIGSLLGSINDSLQESSTKQLLNKINSDNDGMKLQATITAYKAEAAKVSSDSDQDIHHTCIYKSNADGSKTVQAKQMLTQYINPFINQFCQVLKTKSQIGIIGFKNTEAVDFSADKKNLKVYWYFDITPSFSAADGMSNGIDDIKKIVQNIAGKNQNVSFDNAIVDDRIRLGFACDFAKKNPQFELCKELPGYQLLMLMNGNKDLVAQGDINNESKEIDLINNSYYDNQEELLRRKQTIDRETIESLKFIKYPIENIKVKTMSCVFGNNFTKLNLEAFDGFAPQFTGGQDTVIEVNIQTQDDDTVRLINLLPKVSAEYVRDYKLVLSCWPVRIDSEMTRLLGVNEVMIESVDCSTVPGQPGLYNISLRMISVDRTVRNREALKKIDNINNSGPQNKDTKNNLTAKNYFDLKKALGKAELYPDLELPTIDEMKEVGFEFARYINANNRIFPDPDFYYCYSYALGYEIFRDSILKYFNEIAKNDNQQEQLSYELSDMVGSSATVNITNDEKVYAINKTNEAYDRIQKNNKELEDKTKDIKKKVYQNAKTHSQLGKTYTDIINNLAATDIFGGWNIGKAIKSIFREKKYENATSDKAASECAKQLKDQASKIIEIIDEILSKPLKGIDDFSPDSDGIFKEWTETWSHSRNPNIKGQQHRIETSIDDTVKDFINNKDRYGDLLDALCMPRGNTFDANFDSDISKMLYSAASCRTGLKECGQDKSNTDWQPRAFLITENKNWGHPNLDSKNRVIPVCEVENTVQGKAGNYQALDVEDAIKNGTRFGMYGIKKYAKDKIISMLGITPSINKSNYFIDPYYMNLKEDDPQLIAYKQAIMISPEVATTAFLRNVFVWIRKMLKDNILLSLYDLIQFEVINDIKNKGKINTVSDIDLYPEQTDASLKNIYPELTKASLDNLYPKHKDAKGETNSTVKEDKSKTQQQKSKEDKDKEIMAEETKKFKEQEKHSKDLLKDIKKIMEDNKLPLILGKFFPAFVMIVTDGDVSLYDRIKQRNYDELNTMVMSILSPDAQSDKTPVANRTLRRFLLAMYGSDLIDNITEFAENNDNISDLLNRTIGEKIVIDRADKPAEYIRDSFLDMIQNDKRGRMCRAFPTYYMMFIDEGREIGYWKLHDNFYNMSAIGEIQVTKSRKIAADTAKITMTNLFGSYTEQDTDQKELVGYDLKDAWNSIFSPRTYYLKEELRRTNSAPVDQGRLAPGVRLSLRMGYGADASTLPIVFNGSVAEVGTGELIEIIAQGDGIETMNQIMSNADAEHFEFEGHEPITGTIKESLTMGVTARELICGILTSKGGFIKRIVRNLTDGRLYNTNPYGLVHFGEQDFKKIFENGEVVQNIYEALPQPSWGDDSTLSGEYKTDGAPRISFHTIGKTFWDMLNICATIQPDFVTGVVPFGLRSTIFFGAPRYYYAYDYINDINSNGESTIKEKRKPFQQYHYYTSFSDIIGNSIVTSEKDVKTCAIGMYTERGWLGKDRPKTLSPMFVDFDIYPEKQKTMYFDTQYLAKGSTVGFILPFANWITNNIADEEGAVQGAKAIAWRMTATSLKNSVKEMYQGDLIVMGDPSVKPYDKIWIEDIYNRIQGEAEVEAVVHNFSVDTGFTTSIYPDCVAAVDDRYQQVSNIMTKTMLAKTGAFYGSIVATSMFFSNNTRPFITSLAKALSKGDGAVGKTMEGLGKIIGKSEMDAYGGFINGRDKIFRGLGVNTNKMHAAKYLDGLKNVKGRLKNIVEEKSTIEDITKFYNQLDKLTKELDPKKTISILEKTVSSSKDPEAVKEAILKLKNMNIQSSISQSLKIDSKALEGLQKVIAKEDKDSLKLVKSIIKNNKIDTGELKGFSKVLSKYGSKIDPKSIVKATADISKSAGKVLAESTAEAAIAGEGIMDALMVGGAAGGPIGAIAAIVGIILEMAVSYIITACTQQAITRFLKNLEVLQVYPLMKNGKPLVAGLNGSKGAVVGSGTYEMQGPLQNYISDFFNDEKHWWATNFLRDFFIGNDDMKGIVSTWKRKNNFPDAGDESIVGRETLISDLLKHKAADEIKNLSSIHSMILQPRIQKLNTKEGNMAWRKDAITDIKNIGQNKNITENMVPLFDSEKINKLRSQGYLTLLHDSEQLKNSDKKSKHSVPVEFEINSKKKTCNCIYEPNNIIDIPFLKPDSFYLLIEILDRLKKIFEPPTSEVGSKSGFTEHPIVIESCLRIGDTRSWASTGSVFKISVADYPDFLDKISEKNDDLIITKDGDNLIGSTKLNGTYFTARKTSDNSYMFLVHPTKY